MTSYKDALVLLNELEEYAGVQAIPVTLALITKAREALEKDFGDEFSLGSGPEKTSNLRLVQ